ncbi:LysR family transcriptional regulator [Bordetella petrii]|nr:LysR family transcriptional regulator [Bordetella petrii]
MKLSVVDPKDILVFAAVVEAGTMTAASRVTAKPKASISRAIARLESQLQVRLLERSARTIVVTEAGHLLYEYATRLSQELHDAEAAVTALNGRVQGTLRIGCSLTIGQIFMNPLLPEFVAGYPDLHVKLELTNRTIDLIEEGLDVVLRIGPMGDSSLVAKRLGTLAYGVYASPSYLASRPAVRHPLDLDSLAVVDNFYGKPSAIWEFERRGELQRVKVRPRLDFNDAIMRRDALIRGAGIGLVPHHLCVQAIRAGKLANPMEEWKSTREVDIFAVWPGRQFMTPRLRAFIEFLARRVPCLINGS